MLIDFEKGDDMYPFFSNVMVFELMRLHDASEAGMMNIFSRLFSFILTAFPYFSSESVIPIEIMPLVVEFSVTQTKSDSRSDGE